MFSIEKLARTNGRKRYLLRFLNQFHGGLLDTYKDFPTDTRIVPYYVPPEYRLTTMYQQLTQFLGLKTTAKFDSKFYFLLKKIEKKLFSR